MLMGRDCAAGECIAAARESAAALESARTAAPRAVCAMLLEKRGWADETPRSTDVCASGDRPGRGAWGVSTARR